MDIGPVNRLNVSAPVNSLVTSPQEASMVRQIVTAIRGLNQSELMGQNRQLTFARDPDTQRPVIRIVERETGNVIDQIPPETVLQMVADLDRDQQKGNLDA